MMDIFGGGGGGSAQAQGLAGHREAGDLRPDAGGGYFRQPGRAAQWCERQSDLQLAEGPPIYGGRVG